VHPDFRVTALLAALAAAAIGLVASGWSGLESRLPGGLPVGNAASAAAMVHAAWAAFRLAPAPWIRRIAAVSLAVALLWLPASIALAGNLELNFDGSTGPAWFALTAFALLASWGSLAMAAAARWVARAKARDFT
jgi:hypothetical protein